MPQLHFDPINLIVVIGGIAWAWFKLKAGSEWQATWIKKHDRECEEYKKQSNLILGELKVGNERLTQISVATAQRVDRIEHQMDRA